MYAFGEWFCGSGGWERAPLTWSMSVSSLQTVIVTLFSVTFHLRNYYVPAEQKQIVVSR